MLVCEDVNRTSFIALAVLCAGFCSCSKEAENEPEIKIVTQAPQDADKVAVIGDWSAAEFKEVFEAAKRSGQRFELTFPEVIEVAQIGRIADQGADAIAIGFLPPEKADPLIQEANRLALPVIVFGSDADTFSGEIRSRISMDPYEAGRLAGTTMIAAVGESAVPLGMVSYDQSESAGQLIHGIEESLGRFQRSRLEPGPLLSTVPLPLELLATQRIGGLFVFRSDSLGGTADALEKAARQAEVSVIGFGGDSLSRKQLEAGRLYSLISPETDALAEKTLIAVEAVLSGAEVELIQWVAPAAVFRD